ncbi:type II 3-dehydroquinate dehydratase [Arthrobacter cavernae]|uniref:3-dehydroquinate dehydratase n=1 Tax=Arthrobacter cavernae TaxID=2817681 RepID=A0A939HLE0_9MICC|nr:type II 3-dehydroquinate dehydratase [Arthrobacter cavernae]MBO1269936.1 type II 3-dehydroquinate dehydratase [Arthrobacter cavernae]
MTARAYLGFSAAAHGFTAHCVQSADEAGIIHAVLNADASVRGIVIGAGEAVHSSVALRDALAGVRSPVIEVVACRPNQLGEFRSSLLSSVSTAVIIGAGIHGFKLAIDHLAATV